MIKRLFQHLSQQLNGIKCLLSPNLVAALHERTNPLQHAIGV
jgi:hypothetical protein